LDLAEQRAVDLRDVQCFVLDEAIACWIWLHPRHPPHSQLLPAQRQNLMFSATYSEEIRELGEALCA